MGTKTVKFSQADIEAELVKPYNDRKEFPIGRGGEMVRPRNYAHDPVKKQKMIEEAATTGEAIINPLKGRRGPYWGFVEALKSMGVEKWHTHADVKDKMSEIMDVVMTTKKKSAWSKFADKEARPTAEKPKDVNGKIRQNARVLQRLNQKHSYGLKLAEFGMCVDIYIEPIEGHEKCSDEFPVKGTWHYRLRIVGDSEVKPLYKNPGARRGRRPKGD